jgi:hypothetical protein
MAPHVWMDSLRPLIRKRVFAPQIGTGAAQRTQFLIQWIVMVTRTHTHTHAHTKKRFQRLLHVAVSKWCHVRRFIRSGDSWSLWIHVHMFAWMDVNVVYWGYIYIYILKFLFVLHIVYILQDINECTSSPCDQIPAHTVKCNNGHANWTCTCQPGYTGLKCDAGACVCVCACVKT